MASNHRQERINEQMQLELTEILRTVKDPRVSSLFVSITGVDVTRDFSYARVYFSVLNADGGEVKKGLDSASGYIRSCVAERLNLRVTPKLVFIPDDSTERAMRIAELLKDNK